MKKLYLLVSLLLFIYSHPMRPPALAKNPESLQTLCLKHFLYNTNRITDVRLKRIISREKIEPFEEYEHLFDENVNPKIVAQLQVLLFYDLKPKPNFPLLSMLTKNWPNSEPLVCLQNTLTIIIDKGLSSSAEVCSAIHTILTNVMPNPRFALAEFLIEKGLQNNMCEYFDHYPNSLRVWPTIN